MGSVLSDPRLDLVERFFRGTGSTYDFMVNAATLGIDRVWKRRMVALVRERVGDPRTMLDLACGTGISTFAFARAFPHARIVGVELRDEYLQRARAKCVGVQPNAPTVNRYPNIEFILSRAETYATDQRFDVVSASYLAKYADLPVLADKLTQWLEPNGLLIMHDFTFPPNRIALSVWRGYFWMMQTVAVRIFPAWKEIYDGLPKLIESTQWTSELQALLRDRGFRDVTFEWQTLWGSAIVTARSPS
jgi:demethylmenaquinone methyltransferase/2-methoxy-6-polyprenyl-1,4-benzoquinol methylase